MWRNKGITLVERWDILRHEVSEQKSPQCRMEGSGAILRSSRLFLSKESSVTQEFRLCFYSLSYYVSKGLRHLILSLCLFTAQRQTNENPSTAQREAETALFLTPSTCSPWHWPAVRCAVLNVPSMWSHFFCNFNCSSGNPLKIHLCKTLQVFLLHCGTIKYTTCISSWVSFPPADT